MFATIAPLLLYGAVFLGMHVLKSGWGAILGYHFGIMLVLFATGESPDIKQLLKGWNYLFGLVMVLIAALSGVLIYGLWPHIHLNGLDMPGALLEYGLTGSPWIGFVLYYALINPWLEELFWRGHYAQRVRYPVMSDILFAGYHVLVLVLFVKWVWILVAFVVLVLTAWMWRYLTKRYNGLKIPAISHFVADVSVITAIFILAS